MEVPVTSYPTGITTNRIDASDDDGTTKDSSCLPSSSPELIDSLLARDRFKRSIVASKWYSESLFSSKPSCDDLVAYALSITFKLDDYKSKIFDDTMNFFYSSN